MIGFEEPRELNYPAVWVLSAKRHDPDGTTRYVAFADGKILETSKEAAARYGTLMYLESLGGAPYAYDLVELAEAEATVAARLEELKARGTFFHREPGPTEPEETDEPEDAPTPSGSEPPVKETDHDHDTTDNLGEQIVLCVVYQSHGAAVQPTQAKTHGQLVEITDAHGQPVKPLAHSMAELRLELTRQGYKPEYPAWQWLDRGDPPRRRREVWSRANGNGHSEPAGEVPSLWAGPDGADWKPTYSPAAQARLEDYERRKATGEIDPLKDKIIAPSQGPRFAWDRYWGH